MVYQLIVCIFEDWIFHTTRCSLVGSDLLCTYTTPQRTRLVYVCKVATTIFTVCYCCPPRKQPFVMSTIVLSQGEVKSTGYPKCLKNIIHHKVTWQYIWCLRFSDITLLNIYLSFYGPSKYNSAMIGNTSKESQIQTVLPTCHYYILRAHIIE